MHLKCGLSYQMSVYLRKTNNFKSPWIQGYPLRSPPPPLKEKQSVDFLIIYMYILLQMSTYNFRQIKHEHLIKTTINTKYNMHLHTNNPNNRANNHKLFNNVKQNAHELTFQSFGITIKDIDICSAFAHTIHLSIFSKFYVIEHRYQLRHFK